MDNRGINWKKELAERSEKDYKHIRGISPVSIFAIPISAREQYLPKGERQNIGEEKMDCVSRAVCNWYENELDYAYDANLLLPENKKWFDDNGYRDNGKFSVSDVWVAFGSGTTREGNSLKAPIDFARKNGLIPKKLLPQLNGFDENYAPARITQQMKDLAAEFVKRFTVNYEQVSELQFSQNTDGLVVALYAWPLPINGIYPRVELDPNHSVYRFNNPKNHFIFDNYEENPGDFIKELIFNYNFMDYGYHIYFVSQNEVKKNKWYSKVLDILKNIWKKVAIGGIILISAVGIYGSRHIHTEQTYRIYPDPSLTPGLIRTNDIQDICGHTTGTYRKTTESMKNTVYHLYGIKIHPTGSYEIDHYYPLGIGGADDIKNLWPQPSPEFHAKDKVENQLRIKLCKKEITQQEAIDTINHWDKQVLGGIGQISDPDDE